MGARVEGTDETKPQQRSKENEISSMRTNGQEHKKLVFEDFETALKIYEKYKKVFAATNITLNIAIWNKDGWLIESETVNPTRVIKIN